MAAMFTVFEKFGDVCAALDEADRKELMYAICTYGMFGETVELPYHLAPIFIALKEDIDNSKESRRRGSAGGRPRKESEPEPAVSDEEKPGVLQPGKPQVSQNASKTKSQTKPGQTKPDQTKGVKFTPPATAEVRDYAGQYASEKRLDPGGFDAERFVDYYTSNGWKVGHNAMRDWRAAVRDWVRRDSKPSREVVSDEYSAL